MGREREGVEKGAREGRMEWEDNTIEDGQDRRMEGETNEVEDLMKRKKEWRREGNGGRWDGRRNRKRGK